MKKIISSTITTLICAVSFTAEANNITIKIGKEFLLKKIFRSNFIDLNDITK